MTITIRLSRETDASFDLALEHSPIKKVKKRVEDATIVVTRLDNDQCAYEYYQRREAPRAGILDDLEACKALLRTTGISLRSGWIAVANAGERHA